MEDETAFKILEQLEALSKRLEAVETVARTKRIGAQMSRYCRYTVRDGEYSVTFDSRLAGVGDKERTVASKLASVDQCQLVMTAVDKAVEFLLGQKQS